MFETEITKSNQVLCRDTHIKIVKLQIVDFLNGFSGVLNWTYISLLFRELKRHFFNSFILAYYSLWIIGFLGLASKYLMLCSSCVIFSLSKVCLSSYLLFSIAFRSIFLHYVFRLQTIYFILSSISFCLAEGSDLSINYILLICDSSEELFYWWTIIQQSTYIFYSVMSRSKPKH